MTFNFTKKHQLMEGLAGCISCSEVPLRQYYYVNKTMSWSEAQQYCREKYTDLATFDSMDDLKRLKANFSYSWAWIGLHDDPAAWRTSMGNESNSWRWSATGQTSRTGFQSWNSYSPDYWKGTETCATMDGRGQWNDNVCTSSYTFLCFNVTDQNKKSYIFINQSMSWSSAQQYCRDNHKDLAMIENQEENMEALNAKPSSSKPWIGLYREPWTWSDGSLSSFRNWYPSGSDNYGGNQHCVTENTDHEWGDERCSIERVFVCHQVSKMKTTLRMKFITDADLTDPKVKAQILEKKTDGPTSTSSGRFHSKILQSDAVMVL
ncbi:C-type mannose receptor 2 isoform X2 [Oryzias melastigma]|uniref:C-type mannose receptor 2 isoform X2 n=1 Tax=Oryzias melastigma TaxID=30732 RepID=UPI00168D7D7A|nr:C-type mannose receptor 2 isoform X2 [Oryzias melastigma]